MTYRPSIAALFLGALPFALGFARPSSPCDPIVLAMSFSDTGSGQTARVFPLPPTHRPLALVAVYPLGPTWSGFLVLATCDGRALDTLYTGGVDSIQIRPVTGTRRPEALVFAVPSTGSGGRTSVLSIVAVIADSLHVVWAQPYLDYFFAPQGGGQDTADVTILGPGHLLYHGTSQPFHLDSLSDTLVADGPPCTFVERWDWRPSVDSFVPRPSRRSRARCKAA